jgi:hypothetical protein
LLTSDRGERADKALPGAVLTSGGRKAGACSLSDCCEYVTFCPGVGCRLVGMQEVTENKGKDFSGGRYARTEKELFDKAITLLDKCKVMTGSSDREKLETTVRS